MTTWKKWFLIKTGNFPTQKILIVRIVLNVDKTPSFYQFFMVASVVCYPGEKMYSAKISKLNLHKKYFKLIRLKLRMYDIIEQGIPQNLQVA